MNNPFFPSPQKRSLKDIAQACGAFNAEELGDIEISGIGSLKNGATDQISFYQSSKFRDELEQSRVKACFVSRDLYEHIPGHIMAVIVDSPHKAFGLTQSLFFPNHVNDHSAIHPTTSISPSATIEKNVCIGAFSVVGDHAVIAEGTVIDSHVSIGKHVTIGKNCWIQSHVFVTHTHMGDRVTIKPGAKIGQAGFGFYTDKGKHIDIPQVGMVMIGNDVFIGSNTTIDRGSLYETVIGNNVRIDNLVQIAHNVIVGDGSILVAQVGIAGSCELGQFVTLAGQAGLAPHVKIGDQAIVAAQSGVMRDIDPGQAVGGTPAVPIRDWHRQSIVIDRLVKKKG